MKENDILRKEGEPAGADEVVVRTRHHHWDLLVVPVCILLAFLVWLCVMNVRDTEYIPVRILAPEDGYTYELSADSLEVEGDVVALKRANAIAVILPSDEPGKYVITEENLVLPEGVSLTGTIRLTLTVTAQ